MKLIKIAESIIATTKDLDKTFLDYQIVMFPNGEVGKKSIVDLSTALYHLGIHMQEMPSSRKYGAYVYTLSKRQITDEEMATLDHENFMKTNNDREIVGKPQL